MAYKSKVKPEGFILGHDYTNHLPARNSGFGVVEAVNGFVVEEGYSLLAVTMEKSPTFVLARALNSPASEQLCLQILYASSRVVEIEGWAEKPAD